MKKIISACIVVLLCAGATRAQGIAVGLRAGLNVANESYSGDIGSSISQSARAGFLGGAYVTFKFTGKFGLQPEVLFNSLGSTVKDNSSGIKAVDQLNYLSVPVFFRFDPVSHFHILVGPQFSVLMSAKGKASSGGNSVSVDIKDQYNSGDVGAVVGVGFDFMKFNAGLRYSLGFSNIGKDTGDETVKNNALQLVVGYKLFGK